MTLLPSHPRRAGVVVAVALATTVAAACSDSSDSADSVSSSTAHAAGLTVPAGQELTFTHEQLQQLAGGDTPVAIAKPAHGTITYTSDGKIHYRPEAGFTGTEKLSVTTSAAVKLYTTDIPPLTTVGGVPVQASAYGSALAPVPGSSDEFYGLTDRGPNVDGPEDDQKVLPVPDFQPQIARLKLTAGVATVVNTIKLTGPDGKPLNGLVDPRADTGEKLVDLNGTTLPTSDHGLDTEGLVALPDGTFWISDEYGPFVVHFDATGKEIERLSPFDKTLPEELRFRTANQGMEGLTITPDGTKLVGAMQSALNVPDLSGKAKEVPISRIVVIDLATKKSQEFIYPLDNPKTTKKAISEITAISNTEFLVDERDGELEPGANKVIYKIDIAGATDVGPDAKVAGGTYDAAKGGLLIDGKPLEELVVKDDTDAAIAALTAKGITPVSKDVSVDLGKLVTDLDPAGTFYAHDKVEGLATPDGGKTLYISNDSDFGLVGVTGKNPPFGLKAKDLPGGQQDSGEILVVDTSALPAKTSQHEVSILVG